MTPVAELKQVIAAYQTLIANNTLARERLIERRKGGADHVTVELDERMELHARTIDPLGRAIEVTREQIKLAERK